MVRQAWAEAALAEVALAIEIPVVHRVTAWDDYAGKAHVPAQFVQLGHQGVCQDEVVVDQFAIRAARPIRDAPAQGLERAWQDLADAVAVLLADFFAAGRKA